MKQFWLVLILFTFSLQGSYLYAQDSFVQQWESRVNDIQSKQPAWPVPVVTAYPGLVQLLRTDFVREITPTGIQTWNYDNSRGADLIPWHNTEIDIDVPPYLQHNNPHEQDGFGDFTLQYKYRMFSGNDNHGAYAVSASVAGDVPTGSHSNGSTEATLTPTLYAGKGFGPVNVQTSIGATLPVAETSTLGRPIVWNTVLQYKVKTIFWPEVEFNSTFYHGGPNDGKTQMFVTPGLMVSKFKLNHDPKSRLAILFGSGIQIATSEYHSYNHAVVLTTRLVF